MAVRRHRDAIVRRIGTGEIAVESNSRGLRLLCRYRNRQQSEDCRKKYLAGHAGELCQKRKLPRSSEISASHAVPGEWPQYVGDRWRWQGHRLHRPVVAVPAIEAA